MAYADEITVHDGAPIELYEFAIAGGTTYYYTSGSEDVEYSGNTYTATPIRRDAVSSQGSDDQPEVEVIMPRSAEVVSDLAFNIPPRQMTLTIRRYHVGNQAGIVRLFEGIVQGCSVSGDKASIRVPSLLADAMNTTIPSVAYQSLCNHVLYDARCALTDTDFDLATTVSSFGASEKIINVASVGGAADQVYRAGKIVRDTDGESRLIVAQTSTQITVDREFRTLAAADAVTLFQGCDHTFATCNTKFSNTDNFGGYPLIPTANFHRVGIKGF